MVFSPGKPARERSAAGLRGEAIQLRSTMLNLDRQANDTSLSLDLLRAVAAQMVCVGHGFILSHVAEELRPPHFPFIQNIGVLIFFAMSGFLITATLLHNSAKPDYGFARYFIDRFARIYSGLLPALVFVIVIDWMTLFLTSEPTIARYYNLKTFLANLAMLEGYRGIFPNRLQWSTFGSDSPLWTLAIEWHIYMFVGAAFFLLKGRSSWLVLIPIAVFFGQTPLHFLFGSFQADGVGAGLFALWLGGAALYLLLSRYVPPLWISVPVFVAAGCAYAFTLNPGHEYEMATYPALILAIGSMIAITQQTKAIGAAKLIRVLADYSFTLYLIHYTMMTAASTIFPAAQGWLWFCGMVSASNAIAYLIARPFEMRHRQFASWLADLFSSAIRWGRPAAAVGSRER
jgi:peptidoglycan/LPS O-acetylase OafA/YrhL